MKRERLIIRVKPLFKELDTSQSGNWAAKDAEKIRTDTDQQAGGRQWRRC